MRLVEKLSTFLDIIGIPTGTRSPHIFVASVCGHFVTADLLVAKGTDIPGRVWSAEDLRNAARAYIGVDVVPEVLAEEMRPGLTVGQYWTERAERLLELTTSDPSQFGLAIDEISASIVEAQRRLAPRTA